MSDPEPGFVQVKIYDREYAFRTTGNPERLQMLCASLDSRMRELAESSGTVDTLKVAILTALSIADDLDRAHTELKKLDEALGRRSLECVSMLERFLA